MGLIQIKDFEIEVAKLWMKGLPWQLLSSYVILDTYQKSYVILDKIK